MASVPIDTILSQYTQWRGAQDYKRANPNLFAIGSGGMGATNGDRMVRNVGLGGRVDYQAIRSSFGSGAPTAQAQGYAKYQNDIAATPQVTEFAGYLQRQGKGSVPQIMADLDAGNISKYADQLPQFASWRSAEHDRSKVKGMLAGGWPKLLASLGPAIVTGGAALPLAGRAAIGAAFGGVTGGVKGAVVGGLSAAIAPQIRLPGIKAAVSAPVQSAQSVLQQLTPLNIARGVAAQGISAAAPTRAAAAPAAGPTNTRFLDVASFEDAIRRLGSGRRA